MVGAKYLRPNDIFIFCIQPVVRSKSSHVEAAERTCGGHRFELREVELRHTTLEVLVNGKNFKPGGMERLEKAAE